MNDYTHTVLCVDDEQNILKSLKRIFRKEGYRLLTAASGAADSRGMRTRQTIAFFPIKLMLHADEGTRKNSAMTEMMSKTGGIASAASHPDGTASGRARCSIRPNADANRDSVSTYL